MVWLERLTQVLNANADVDLSGLKSAVLKALYRHTGKDLVHDHVTAIVIEVR